MEIFLIEEENIISNPGGEECNGFGKLQMALLYAEQNLVCSIKPRETWGIALSSKWVWTNHHVAVIAFIPIRLLLMPDTVLDAVYN